MGYRLLNKFWLFSLAIFLGVLFLTQTANSQTTTLPEANKIQLENQKSGSTTWNSPSLAKSKNTVVNSELDEQPAGKSLAASEAITTQSTYTQPNINGYASATSINKGESINFLVSTVQPTYNIHIYRMGYYGGAGAALVKTISNLQGQNQPTPTADPTTKLVEANWQNSYTLQTDSTWTTGIYLAKLTPASGLEGYITFVVRDDATPADILYQVPVTTYQAYNGWGGESLYDFNSSNVKRAYKVSFNRPYDSWAGAGGFFDGEYNMVRFLEANGYNVSYATSLDTHTNPNLLNNKKVFLSERHDEYWSAAMRDNVTNFRNNGKDLAFFSANSIYWQVRFENSATGQANRTMVSYKEAYLDPMSAINPALTTVTFRDPPVNKPENELLGVMYESYYDFNTAYPWRVTNSSFWVYAGTNLKEGDLIPGMVGYEYDKVWHNGLTPVNLVILSESPVTSFLGPSVSSGAIYETPLGSYVFASGTIDWDWKVDDNEYQAHGADTRVKQMTKNILNRMLDIPIPSPSAQPTATPTPKPSSVPTPTPSPTPKPSGDFTPPVVSITNPVNGQKISTKTEITLQANASDNVKVMKVQFWINNVQLCVDNSFAYSCQWTVPSGKGIVYTIMAKAFDTSNNSSSSTVTITSK